ncbi:MAG: dockerin type I repeat-containing protein [Clostridiales bacterium]|nr:dockerin type I repeat-containing protein [Clostridiales bacterium]
MNNKAIKSVVSYILTVVMLFGITTSAFAADSTYSNPIVVVNGIADNPIVSNPNTAGAEVIFPPSDTNSIMLTAEMYTLGITALATNDYTEIMNYFVGSQLFEILEAIQLNPDGTSKSDNIGVNTYEYSLAYYATDEEVLDSLAGTIGIGMADRVGADNVYVYTYDWRLDPLENAKGLNEFIQNVKAKSNKSQVSIISEGYGSTIATAYLAECYEDATSDVDNFVTVNSAFEGSSIMGDIYSGHLIHQYNQLQNLTSAFIRYTNDFSDNPITWFSTWLTNYILNTEWETQDLMAQVITMMGHILDELYDDYLREMLKSFPGLWALVPVDYYEEALDWMFIDDTYTDGDYNSELQEKIQAFKNYQTLAMEKDSSNFLVKAESEGINIAIVSCWDIQLVPIGDNTMSDTELFGLSAQSDGLIDTYYSSFGATTIPLNDVGAAAQHTQEYNEGECANHDHLSATYDYLDPEHDLGAICHYIDASTCALPENTFFIQNMKYGSFDTESNSMDFLEYLVTATTTTSIRSNGKYTQFNVYNRYVSPGVLNADYTSIPGDYLLGDVNLDGTVTPADARLALRIAARLEDYPDVSSTVFKNADVNGDGVISSADARIILRVTAGLSSFADFLNTSDAD